jgi:hypothetical protein
MWPLNSHTGTGNTGNWYIHYTSTVPECSLTYVSNGSGTYVQRRQWLLAMGAFTCTVPVQHTRNRHNRRLLCIKYKVPVYFQPLRKVATISSKHYYGGVFSFTDIYWMEFAKARADDTKCIVRYPVLNTMHGLCTPYSVPVCRNE